MRGKLGLVIGLGVGYVLGTRAGRRRYEQIKASAQKVWELDQVQEQVDKVKDFAASNAMKLPRVAFDGAVRLAKTVTATGATPGQKLDATLDEAKDVAEDVKKAADD